jgi:antitoxin component of RelBE/YafQ-DinJ toxin-antitoxin module
LTDIVKFIISFEGNSSDSHRIDLYDIAQALTGFQRSLALTTHLILNDQVITQAPSLKNAEIYSLPPEDGSWKMTAVICTALYSLSTAPKDTPLGHIIYSAYDYVISESLGVHVDYDKTLGKLYKESKNKKLPKIKQYQLDSIIEKCSFSIKEMHRPIYQTQTATKATISAIVNNKSLPISSQLSLDTYAHLKEELISSEEKTVEGYISSYNINTYKGRIYIPTEGRPIPFELSESIKNKKTVEIVVDNLSKNALNAQDIKKIKCIVFEVRSNSAKLKRYIVKKILI